MGRSGKKKAFHRNAFFFINAELLQPHKSLLA